MHGLKNIEFLPKIGIKLEVNDCDKVAILGVRISFQCGSKAPKHGMLLGFLADLVKFMGSVGFSVADGDDFGRFAMLIWRS
jgi:hypothetical protein